jgi:hypothetical protein
MTKEEREICVTKNSSYCKGNKTNTNVLALLHQESGVHINMSNIHNILPMV